MGRRNYDLTGITPGSPAWILQQERKHRRAGLPGPAPVHETPSTPTGGQNDVSIDGDRTPRALPTVPEEMDDKTPTVANFPAGTLTGIGKPATEDMAATQPPSVANPRASQTQPTFESQPPNEASFVSDFELQPDIPSERSLEVPYLGKDPEDLGPLDEQCLAPIVRDDIGLQLPTTQTASSWQPMTMEDFDLGNRVLQALASQSEQNHIADSCIDSNVFREDNIMGED
jgi:hypothetical protein